MDGWGGQASADRRADVGLGGAVARKRHGRHYTPERLARFLAERVAEHVAPRGELRVLDPACGDGELLLAVERAVASRFPGIRVRLTGFDLNAAAIRVARERAEGLDADWREGDFLSAADELAGESFDVVITNPPYVRTQQLGSAAARLLSRRFGLSGRIDLTHPFVACVPRLLRPGGVLGLLCANRFLTTKAGTNLRALLRSDLHPVELYDLGDTRLFDAAVLPAITIAVRAHPDDPCRYVSAYELGTGENVTGTDLFAALNGTADTLVTHSGRVIAIEVGTLAPGDPATEILSRPAFRATGDEISVEECSSVDPAVPWRMSRPGTDRWLRQVGEGTWRTFGEVARIRVGIKTTADRVFISDRWEQCEPRPETELLFDLLTHHDLAPWRIARERPTRVLYPYDITRTRRTPVDLGEYPLAAAYLADHKDRLAARGYVVSGGREWYEIWVPQRPHLWAFPKLVFPDISVRPRFALDRSGAIVNGDCYWISLPDIGDDALPYLLMGVANSTLGLRFYDAVCGNRLYAGRRRWITQYVARLPLPDPATPAAAALAELVRGIVDDGIDPVPEVVDERVAAAFRLES
ncbi:SAM-dependent methyltransferase [Nocardia transvalensis]|uniref:site-specific DNA-methyltransferase (adenine-specific) n=1 Tax=Nocardia transvalensis TaxID=37333 RepID=A0A7W9PL87_9NOCA|nr:N-6 DNA methylase [Nocardia transvalensis]MBB5918202.1 SAM-dependent methyltransferase [Nocardia transvalensis]